MMWHECFSIPIPPERAVQGQISVARSIFSSVSLYTQSPGWIVTFVCLCRDHAAWCPYCQKVWLQLEEKRIPYVIEKINMRC